MTGLSEADAIRERPVSEGLAVATIDLDAYFRRIGYAGRRSPTLDALRELHLRHAQTIPFENLNPLLGWPVKLDVESVERKLVRDRRGGYCFEQNLLFKLVLEALGFRVAGLAARVMWNDPVGAVTPRTHMLLEVGAEGESFVADVGFGGQTLTGPLRLVPDAAQDTPHGRFRLRPVGGEFVMDAEVRGEWKSLYRFDRAEPEAVDYEVANWYVATCPTSRFVIGLSAARAAPGKRYALRDVELAVHTPDDTERRTITSVTELRAVLTDVFGIALPDGPELDAALERVIAKPPPAP